MLNTELRAYILQQINTKSPNFGQISQMINAVYDLYKNKQYYTRQKVSSYKNKTSKHILDALKIYNIDKVTPNRELAMKTGCTLSSLKQIVKKGEEAAIEMLPKLQQLKGQLREGKSSMVVSTDSLRVNNIILNNI
jgi:hypothetical protein